MGRVVSGNPAVDGAPLRWRFRYLGVLPRPPPDGLPVVLG